MKKKWFIPLVIFAFLVLAALIYTRPMPLEALCEADVTQCKSVFGYHFREPQVEDTRFEFPADDVRGQQLTTLFAQQKFRRSLANLLPQGGTTHRTQDGDFRWEVGFCFDLTDFPDASTGKGVLITCRNFFGKLSLFRAYDGTTIRCTVQNQDAFLQQVYGVITSEP